MVAFSSMSSYAKLTTELIRHIRICNPSCYIVWGGIHRIVVPEYAIKYAVAICTGEGEFAFEQFFDAFKEGRNFTGTRNFWFKEKGEKIRNGFLP